MRSARYTHVVQADQFQSVARASYAARPATDTRMATEFAVPMEKDKLFGESADARIPTSTYAATAAATAAAVAGDRVPPRQSLAAAKKVRGPCCCWRRRSSLGGAWMQAQWEAERQSYVEGTPVESTTRSSFAGAAPAEPPPATAKKSAAFTKSFQAPPLRK